MRNTGTRREVTIPIPLGHQRPALASGARFKLLPAGRRWGKTRVEFRGVVWGHGPRVKRSDRTRKWRGLSDGGNMLWVAPDYPQSRAIWEEEIMPRFHGVRGVKLNESERTVELTQNGGRLEIRSAESIDGVRGRKHDGIVIDEAAFMKLAYAWRRVLRPTLTDFGGWAMIASTTHVGSDFNSMVKAARDGERPGWEVFQGRTRDNKLLPAEEVELLYSEYPPGSTDLLQELEAELVETHGELFKQEYFKWYKEANRYAMWVEDASGAVVRFPFIEIKVFVDLASSMKQRADYVNIKVVGYTAPTQNGTRKAGVLHEDNVKLEGPQQIALLKQRIEEWQPTETVIESVGYQLTAIQHLRQAMPNRTFREFHPDKDKRSRAVPAAAAMARGDIFWNPNAPIMRTVTIPQHLKFPNGKDGSEDVSDHDDSVDTTSMLGAELAPMHQAWLTRSVRR